MTFELSAENVSIALVVSLRRLSYEAMSNGRKDHCIPKLLWNIKENEVTDFIKMLNHQPTTSCSIIKINKQTKLSN